MELTSRTVVPAAAGAAGAVGAGLMAAGYGASRPAAAIVGGVIFAGVGLGLDAFATMDEPSWDRTRGSWASPGGLIGTGAGTALGGAAAHLMTQKLPGAARLGATVLSAAGSGLVIGAFATGLTAPLETEASYIHPGLPTPLLTDPSDEPS